MPTHIYLSPGMFGFGRLASFSYFEHLESALVERFRRMGRSVHVQVCDVHPTASIRRRAVRLARMVADTAGSGTGPIHLLGHSTGGLDARLVASPAVHLPGIAERDLAWLPRLRSVTTMNTPHYGTPLAAFFATKSGQQVLYAVTALTVTVLKLGAPPLAATSALVAALSRLSGAIELGLVERTSESIIRMLDEASSRELRSFLRLIRDDQGAVIQLTPEAMDLFQASVEDRPGIRYPCVASYAPRNGARGLVATLRSPWSVASAAIFTALHEISQRLDDRYPCHHRDSELDRKVRASLGALPHETASDGVVPYYSQLWGEVAWTGLADHLDVVGHFPGRRGKLQHVDWLKSGANFDEARFDSMLGGVVDGMLLSERP
jgi:triacylglycerol lipase